MPDCNGPGRNSATKAIISSRESGSRRLISSFMPRDSSWNTAVVSARLSISKVLPSSRGMASILSGPWPAASRTLSTISSAQSMMVRVRKPRKSNLTRPASSISFLSNCTTKPAPSSSHSRGEKSVSLVGAITTPPACLPVPRVVPSSFRAISQISSASSSFSMNSLSAGSCSMALASVMPTSNGISLESLSPSE